MKHKSCISLLKKPLSFMLGFLILSNSTYSASLTDVNLEIQPGSLTIGAPSILQFHDTTIRNYPQISVLTATGRYNSSGTNSYDQAMYLDNSGYNPTASTYSTDITGDPNMFFWVEDLAANDTGWCTQLSVSDLTATGANTVKKITKDKIDAKVTNGVVTKIASNDSTPSQMNIRPGAQSWSNIGGEQALTILTRTGSTNGVVGKYGFLPEFAVRVPAFQSVGSYTGTLSYTISESCDGITGGGGGDGGGGGGGTGGGESGSGGGTVPYTGSITTSPITLSGLSGPTTLTCSNDCTDIARNGEWAGGTSQTGFVSGDTVTAKIETSSESGVVTTTTIYNGGTPLASWSAADTGSTVTSDTMTLSGFTGPLTASCSNDCTDIAKNGVWAGGTSLGGFMPGDTLTVKIATGSDPNTTTTTTITVGSNTLTTWSVTTKPDTTPDLFSFTNQTDVETGTTIISNTVTVTGFDGPINARCSSNCIDMARNGTWASGNTIVGFMPGDTVTIKMISSQSFDTLKSAYVVMGGRNSNDWTVRTRIRDTIPDEFSFTDQTGVDTNSGVTSNTVTLTGFEGTINASCGTSCSGIAKNGSWSGVTVYGFSSGDTVTIRKTSSASYDTTVTANITIGTPVKTWNITTRVQDTAPNAFGFTNQTSVNTSAYISSDTVTVSGFDGPITATCGAGCTGIQKNSTGTWTTTVNEFYPGDTITIKTLSSTSYNTTTTATVNLGTVTSSTWSVTTEPPTISCGTDTVQYEGGPYDAAGTTRNQGGYYRTVLIGGQCWLKDNLNVGSMLSTASTLPTDNLSIEKWCYDNNSSNCNDKGGLYSWDEAMNYIETEGAQGICPTGWHIPTESEIFTLVNGFSSSSCSPSVTSWQCSPASTALRSGGSSGFEGVWSGYRSGTSYTYTSLTNITYFSASTLRTGAAYSLELYSPKPEIIYNGFSKAHGISIRCILD